MGCLCRSLSPSVIQTQKIGNEILALALSVENLKHDKVISFLNMQMNDENVRKCCCLDDLLLHFHIVLSFVVYLSFNMHL